MLKKRFLLVVLVLAICINLVYAQETYCCISEFDGCKETSADLLDDPSEGCPLGDLSSWDQVSGSCSALDECKVGCCISGAQKIPLYKVQCDYVEAGTILEENPFMETDTTEFSKLCEGVVAPECTSNADCPIGSLCDLELNRCIPESELDQDVCFDGKLNTPEETDIDCGNICGATCNVSQKCEDTNDCLPSLTCDATTKTCKEGLCRNGVIDLGEQCEPAISINETCVDIDPDYFGGELDCNMVTCQYDTSGCITTEERKTSPTYPEGSCGDGIIQTPNINYFPEQCDGDLPYPECVCTTDCVCEEDCSVNPGTVSLTSAAFSNEGVALTWNYGSDKLCDVSGYYIYKCEAPAGQTECTIDTTSSDIPVDDPDQTDYLDTDLEEDKRYCYQIGARFEKDGVVLSEQKKCITTGVGICFERDDGKYCENGNVIQCTNGINKTIECGTDKFCSMPQDKQAECVTVDDCDKCNGLFRVFGGIALEAPFGETFCKDVVGCSYDYTDRNVDKYWKCTEVDSCYNYKSGYACEENTCNIGECKWQDINPEVGAGVCVPTKREYQDCNLCNELEDEILFNPFFSQCSEDVCQKFGMDSSGETSCIALDEECHNSEDAGCAFYLTETDCIGGSKTVAIIGRDPAGQEFEIDVDYQNNERTGNTNAPIQFSKDKFEYGKCKWLGDGCIKDGDGDNADDCNDVKKDLKCVNDNTEPETSLAPIDNPYENGKIKVGKDIDIGLSLSEDAITYFCMQNDCYPNIPAVCSIQNSLKSSNAGGILPGEYTLRYYSEDLHNNLEMVKEETIVLDNVLPEITITPDTSKINELIINMESSEIVTCSAELRNFQGIVQRADISSTENNNIKNEKGIAFSRSYYNLRDESYFWWYTCFDEAGNKVNDTERIEVDTNIINFTDDTQYQTVGSSTNTLTFTTQTNANCSYAEQNFDEYGPAPEIEQMQTAVSVADLGLSHSIIVNPTDGLNMYAIKCQVGEKIISELNDRFVVLKDVVGPNVNFYSTVDRQTKFEELNYATPVLVFVECKDNEYEKQYGLKMDAGCDYSQYVYEGIEIKRFNHTDDALIGPLIFDQKFMEDNDYTEGFPLQVDPWDKLGNAGEGGKKEIKVDESVQNFTLDLDIIEISNDPVRGPLSPKEYLVVLTSSGAIHEVIDASYTIKGFETENLGFIPGQSTTSRFVYRMDLSSDRYLQKGLLNGSITVTATVTRPRARCFSEDSSDITITKDINQSFKLNTNVPTLSLYPLLAGLDNVQDDSSVFPSHDYPLYYYPNERKYYTNDPNLFITGEITSNLTYMDKIVLLSGKENGYKKNIYDIGIKEDNGTDPFDILTEAPAGDTFVGVSGGRPGFVRFLGHPIREEYGSYNHYYGIEVYTEFTINLTTPLEKDVKKANKAKYHMLNHPPEWFGLHAQLEEGFENHILVYGVTKDNVESPNYPKGTPLPIILDTHAPFVTEKYPDGATNEQLDYITIKVKESRTGSSELDINKVEFKLIKDGSSVCENCDVSISEYADTEHFYYDITYTHTKNFEKGTYNVSIKARDKAGNFLVKQEEINYPWFTWTFKIDEGYASQPEWTIYNKGVKATKSNDIWYTQETPSFDIEFKEETIDIALDGVYASIYQPGVSGGQQLREHTCQKLSANKFNCKFDEDLNVPATPQDVYLLSVQAYRDLTSGTVKKAFYDSLPVVIDNEPPVITDFPDFEETLAGNENARIKIKIPNERFELQGEVYYSVTDKNYDLKLNFPEGVYQSTYEFGWDTTSIPTSLKDELKELNDITFLVKDLSGNVGIPVTRKIRIDLSKPNLAGITMVPVGAIEKPIGSKNYYIGNSTVKIRGTSLDDDIARIYFIKNSTPPIFANVDLFSKTYGATVELEGSFGNETKNPFSIVVIDQAENDVAMPFNLFLDLKGPSAEGYDVIIE